MHQHSIELDILLKKMLVLKGSDLHLKSNTTPRARVAGEIIALDEVILTDTFFQSMLEMILDNEAQLKLRESKEYDGYYISGENERFRLNVFYHLNGYALVFRIISSNIKTLEELHLPPSVQNFTAFQRGLVLVTGTTGSGKSTTLAAIIDGINTKRKCHIITIEDPIEFVHKDKCAIVEQRNVGEHTHSYKNALKAALREDPDVILIGEMRDIETMETAIHAANTGHLVLSTLHTLDAKETIDRIIGSFPPYEQNRVRMTLASVLQGIVSQRLVKRQEGGLCAAVEVLLSTERVKQMIIDGKDQELFDVIKEGSVYGMQTFDQALAKLYEGTEIEKEEAIAMATRPNDLKMELDKIDSNQKIDTLETIALKETHHVSETSLAIEEMQAKHNRANLLQKCLKGNGQ